MPKGEKRVFVSYSRKDKEFAHQLGDLLSKRGVSVFIDANVMPGEAWSEILRREIEKATALILLVPSSDVLNRNSLWFEAGAAKALGKPVFAVLPPHHKIAGVDLPINIANLLVLDADEGPLERIADMLSQAVPEGQDPKITAN